MSPFGVLGVANRDALGFERGAKLRPVDAKLAGASSGTESVRIVAEVTNFARDALTSSPSERPRNHGNSKRSLNESPSVILEPLPLVQWFSAPESFP